jgi:DNA-binding NtrC family response regulator
VAARVTRKLPLVVCVDDDAVVLSTIARCLKRAPLDVRATTSPSEALGWIAADEVAVLVSDYDMPEMTGAQLAGHTRRVRPETVRILLTGKRTLETAIDGINQGEIFRFLEKPFDPDVLGQVVQAAAERNRELLAATGDRERRQRREALRAALEAEHPGISEVTRLPDELYELPADPWRAAAELGLAALTPALDR